MPREERARLDRERRAYRLKLDTELNGPARAGGKEEKHMARERALGRVSAGFSWDLALDIYGHRCAFCGTEEFLTVDHIVPLSRGGSNWQWNIRPLCELCNAAKGSQLDAEFPLGRKI